MPTLTDEQIAAQAKSDLDVAIERLYEVFAKYELSDRAKGFIPEEMIDNLHRKPMQDMTSEDLNAYSFDAVIVWGNAKQYKHFLPRIYELIAYEGFKSNQPEHLFLRVSDLRSIYPNDTWTPEEYASIEQFFQALWRYELSHKTSRKHPSILDSEISMAESILLGIGWVVDDIRPYLNVWLNMGTSKACAMLQEFLYENLDWLERSEPLYKDKNDYPQGENIIAWFQDKNTLQTLKDKLAAETNGEKRNYIEKSVELLETFHLLQSD